MSEGVEGVEGEKHGGELPPPAQTSVRLICSISTITSPASSSIIMSGGGVFTEQPGCCTRTTMKKGDRILKMNTTSINVRGAAGLGT